MINLEHGRRAWLVRNNSFLYQILGEGREKHVAREKLLVKKH